MIVASPVRVTAVVPRPRAEAADVRSHVWVSPGAALLAVLALLASARWAVLAGHGGPPGMDPGNWLAFGHSLLGQSVRDPAIVYPPLVPLLCVASVAAFGLQPGLDVLAAVASLAPGVGLFLLLRAVGIRWLAVAAAAVLSASSSVGEAAAWGGYPQLLALGFLLALLGALHLLLTTARWRWAVAASALLLGCLASNELVGVAALIAGALLLTYHVTVLRSRHGWTALRALAVAGAVLAPSVLLIPTYLTLISTTLAAQHALGSTGLSAAAVAGAVGFQFRDLPGLWLAALACSFFTALTFPRWVRQPAVVVGWVLLCTTAVLVLGTAEPRFMYLLPAAALLAVVGVVADVAALVTTRRHLHIGIGLVGVALCAAAALAGLRYYQQQVTFYGRLTPSDVGALTWLRDSTPRDAVVAVTRAGSDFTLGWWVEGVANRRAVYDAELGNLNYADERERVLVAQSIFTPGATLTGMCDTAATHGIDYLFLDKSWSGYDQLDFSSVDVARARVVRNTGSLLLVQCESDAS